MIGIQIDRLFVQKCASRNVRLAPAFARSCMVGAVTDAGAPPMTFTDARSEGTVEECLDELNDFMAQLERYAPPVLAMALRVHLGALLQALLEKELCTREEMRDFVRELERDALQNDEP